MAPKDDSMQVLPPEPVDERSPLLGHNNGSAGNNATDEEDALAAQAEQERREYGAGHAPVADEPSTKKLLLTMGSLYITTFFAALGTSTSVEFFVPSDTDNPLRHLGRGHSLRTHQLIS